MPPAAKKHLNFCIFTMQKEIFSFFKLLLQRWDPLHQIERKNCLETAKGELYTTSERRVMKASFEH